MRSVMAKKNKILSALKHDIKADKELEHAIKHEKSAIKHEKKSLKKKDPKKKNIKSPRGKAKVKIVMEEFKEGKLRSGSKHGPQVINPKQAIAIALSEARKVSKKKKRK